MFHEALLESSAIPYRRRNWPMVLAVTLEAIVCGVLLALPLFSSGVIAVAARTSRPVSLEAPKPPRIETHTMSGGSAQASGSNVMPIASKVNKICVIGCQGSVDESNITPNTTLTASPTGLPDGLLRCTNCRGPGPAGPPRIISNLDPGALIFRVEPLYPRIAELIQVHGIVRLHAIIATDGTIKSLAVIEGSPYLAKAAKDAVQRWRYRPYILNGQPVEVETVITVNFKKID